MRSFSTPPGFNLRSTWNLVVVLFCLGGVANFCLLGSPWMGPCIWGCSPHIPPGLIGYLSALLFFSAVPGFYLSTLIPFHLVTTDKWTALCGIGAGVVTWYVFLGLALWLPAPKALEATSLRPRVAIGLMCFGVGITIGLLLVASILLDAYVWHT